MAYLDLTKLQSPNVTQRLDWGRLHFQVHSWCWQNPVPCNCRFECSGCLLVVSWWLPSTPCHISLPTYTLCLQSHWGSFQSEYASKMNSYTSYCNQQSDIPRPLPEVTGLAHPQQRMCTRRWNCQGLPKSLYASFSGPSWRWGRVLYALHSPSMWVDEIRGPFRLVHRGISSLKQCLHQLGFPGGYSCPYSGIFFAFPFQNPEI